uniref:TPR domain protein in aerotolerance operon n=1 Tax=uncultured Thiotrichaceae bacterium TaxID=298394 RepID=A0A6S6T3Y6_9GAMM|nr:MAG: TPR domain protein in aerotolerance operon [uncultured Thiotrichaceae bacterium]
MMNDFHFMYPGWLWLLLLVPLVGWRILRQQGKGDWAGIVDEQLAPFVLSGKEQPHRLRTALIIALLSILAILALSGPAWEKKQLPAFRSQQAVVVALDLSASMYARDMMPNRLDAARFKLLDLLNIREDGQTGLVVFAGDAFVVSPLTDDTDTIAAQVKNLSPEIMPAQGSYMSAAISKAVETLDQGTQGNGHILLISDGANDEAQARQAAEAAYKKGYTVSILTVGTKDGAPIPMSNGGFLTDSSGQTVMPVLDVNVLRGIADAGNGLFVQHSIDELDLKQLNTLWAASMQDAELLAGHDRKLDAWFNQGIWLVLLLIPVAMLFFRRGWLAVWLLVFVLPQPQQVQAAVWDDLWQTPDQQGQQALQDGDAAGAADLFENPDWKAAAAYRAKDYAQAEALYAQSKTQEGLYNYGNVLARQGKLDEAIAAYDELLKQNPDHDDALHNKNVLESQKNQQEQQNQESGESDEQQDGEQNNQNNEQQDGNGQQQDQSGESEDSESPQEGESSEGEADEQDQSEQSADEAEQEQSEEEQGNNPEQAMDAETEEKKQAMEQWLRRIPDDPAGLWRRKFQYQYRKRSPQAGQGEAW